MDNIYPINDKKESFLKKAIEKHGNMYDYSEVNITNSFSNKVAMNVFNNR